MSTTSGKLQKVEISYDVEFKLQILQLGSYAKLG